MSLEGGEGRGGEGRGGEGEGRGGEESPQSFCQNLAIFFFNISVARY